MELWVPSSCPNYHPPFRPNFPDSACWLPPRAAVDKGLDSKPLRYQQKKVEISTSSVSEYEFWQYTIKCQWPKHVLSSIWGRFQDSHFVSNLNLDQRRAEAPWFSWMNLTIWPTHGGTQLPNGTATRWFPTIVANGAVFATINMAL